MPSMAFRRLAVTSARASNCRRNSTWWLRSPVSAAVTAYCIGPTLQRRPSAISSTAASTASSRAPPLTAIQPARHPGARYAFDSDENEMTGASGL